MVPTYCNVVVIFVVVESLYRAGKFSKSNKTYQRNKDVLLSKSTPTCEPNSTSVGLRRSWHRDTATPGEWDTGTLNNVCPPCL